MKRAADIPPAWEIATPAARAVGMPAAGRAGWRGRARRIRGFSLVEVTLAIGIVAFGVVAVMGVLPIAMVSVRDAMDRVTEMNLVREFSGEALNTPYSRLLAWAAAGPHHFDEQGRRCAPADAHFAVTLDLAAPQFPIAQGMDLATIPALETSSKIVRIEVVRRPAADGQNERKTHTLHVANSGF